MMMMTNKWAPSIIASPLESIPLGSIISEYLMKLMGGVEPYINMPHVN